jgi:uncharacterized membrane protein
MGETPILPSHIQEAVDAIADLHRRHHQRTTPVQRSVAQLTSLVARPRFVGLLTLGLGAWIIANGLMQAVGLHAPDPAPFNSMQAAMGIAGVYITLLILITQRRENELLDARNQLTLELAILNEQKSAKIVALLEELRRDMPGAPDRHDPEAEMLSAPADPRAIMDAIRTLTEDFPLESGGTVQP